MAISFSPTSLIKPKKTFPTKVQLWRQSTRCKPGELGTDRLKARTAFWRVVRRDRRVLK